MSRDPTVRAAEKEAQLARLAAKGTPEYPALYAAQPHQVRKAAELAKDRKAFHAAKQAANKLAASDAQEAAAGFGNMVAKARPKRSRS